VKLDGDIGPAGTLVYEFLEHLTWNEKLDGQALTIESREGEIVSSGPSAAARFRASLEIGQPSNSEKRSDTADGVTREKACPLFLTDRGLDFLVVGEPPAESTRQRENPGRWRAFRG
jgi:hypothetical protein